MHLRMTALVLATVVIASPAFALTPDDAPCAKVSSKEHSSCIVTRDYLTLAKKVINGKLDPKKLPDRPHSFRESFLSKSEVDLVKKAMFIAAMALIEDADNKKKK